MKQNISLREKKYAKTKISIMNVFIKHLHTMRYEDISIQDICKEVEVSEGTFFNYFPRKFDVLLYFLELGSIKRNWIVEQQCKKKSALDKIDLFFELMSDKFQKPHFVYEMVRALIREHTKEKSTDISLAEKVYAFPDCPGIENSEPSCPEAFFEAKVVEAKQQKEIADDADTQELVILLTSILIGVLLATPEEKYKDVPTYHKKQLAFLKKGLHVHDA